MNKWAQFDSRQSEKKTCSKNQAHFFLLKYPYNDKAMPAIEIKTRGYPMGEDSSGIY